MPANGEIKGNERADSPASIAIVVEDRAMDGVDILKANSDTCQNKFRVASLFLHL